MQKYVMLMLLGIGSAIAPPNAIAQDVHIGSDRCLIGYPDGSFRGERPVTRYEFAAALNRCFRLIEDELQESTSNLASPEEVGEFRNDLQRFQEQLESLSDRVETAD
ncbi:MAG: hypothetical protein ACLFV6_13475 [Spirulinaceae cyanobacterium]